jgi:hypothetical protein
MYTIETKTYRTFPYTRRTKQTTGKRLLRKFATYKKRMDNLSAFTSESVTDIKCSFDFSDLKYKLDFGEIKWNNKL